MADLITTPEQWANCVVVLEGGVGRTMPSNQVEIYYELLGDIDYETLKSACLRALQECDQNFIPAIGLIRRLAAEETHGLIPGWEQEWATVRRMVSRWGYPRESEALASLNERTRRAVQAVGYQAICDSEQISIQAGQFRMAYEAIAKREVDHRRLSADLVPPTEAAVLRRFEAQKAIEQVANRLKVTE